MGAVFFERDAVNCILRPCLQWIDGAEAQGHAIVFVAKFFGRAGLMSFISAVPENRRLSLFQSLLFEAAGRTVNPVNGAVGLLWTGNWHICQEAVETVLHGGTLRPISDLVAGQTNILFNEASEACTGIHMRRNPRLNARPRLQQQHRSSDDPSEITLADLDLGLTPCVPVKIPISSMDKRRLGSLSMNSEESVTTACFESCTTDNQALATPPKLLGLFH